jgi:gamma-glutamyltranspeptidase/glutathione hydrolase
VDFVVLRRLFIVASLLILCCCWEFAAKPKHAKGMEAEPQRDYANSTTVSRYGIVATSQAVASQAGAAILARGGSAVDAAIAANAALGVIEPMMNGMGGDLFAIVYDAKTGKLYGLNSSGWSPQAMTIDA